MMSVVEGTSTAAELHRWARDNCKDPEVLYSIATDHDCSGAILEYWLSLIQDRLEGWQSDIERPGPTWDRLHRSKPRRDPSGEALALRAQLVEAMCEVAIPWGLNFGLEYDQVRRLEYVDPERARTGLIVEVSLGGTGIKRRLVIFAEES